MPMEYKIIDERLFIMTSPSSSDKTTLKQQCLEEMCIDVIINKHSVESFTCLDLVLGC